MVDSGTDAENIQDKLECFVMSENGRVPPPQNIHMEVYQRDIYKPIEMAPNGQPRIIWAKK